MGQACRRGKARHAVVPVKITTQTQFEGLEQQQQQGTGGSGQQQPQQSQQQQRQALQQLAPGDQLTATVMTQKGENVAQKIKFDESKGKEQQLDGKIARASGTMVDVDYEGAIVPLKVDKDTQFTGVKSVRELKEGDQIRASFRLENGTTNVATKVEAEQQNQQQQY